MCILPILHKGSVLLLERYDFLVQVSIDGVDIEDPKMRWFREGSRD